MTTVPKRLAIKFKFKQNPTVNTKDIVPVFQRWIQEHTVEGMLIDVVDYKHVQNGPGIILIADEGDYAYDLGEGQIGIKYIRKRALPDNVQDALRLVLRLGFVAAQRLEDEPILDGAAFDYTAAQISFMDRQHYPNQPETLAKIEDELVAFLSALYGAEVAISRANTDEREVFAVNYQVAQEVDLAHFETRLALDKASIS